MIRLTVSYKAEEELLHFLRLLPATLIHSIHPALHKPPKGSGPYCRRYVLIELPTDYGKLECR